MKNLILVINPGSTSTKIALYQEKTPLWTETIHHEDAELKQYPTIFAQLEMRCALTMECLEKHAVKVPTLCAVVARGGLLPPVPAGAIQVNPEMLEVLEHHPMNHHASNLGAAMAYRIAQQAGVKSYIYDPVTVDEMTEVARLTGLAEVRRFGQGHNLNMRAAALRFCRENGRSYEDANLLVAHLGGGITMSLHSHGRMIDMLSDDDGAFSPERAGEIPTYKLVNLIFDQNLSREAVFRILQRQGGLRSHLGTSDAREVERRAEAGDAHAALVYDAMALNVARGLGRLAVLVNGKIDAILLTGGIAYSVMFTDLIKKRVSFLAPVHVLAGENEMQALAEGIVRVLNGEETAREYHWQDGVSR